MQTHRNTNLTKIVYVFMDELKFARLFPFFPSSHWRFVNRKPEEIRDAEALLRGDGHVMVDASAEKARAVGDDVIGRNALFIMPHADVHGMINILHDHFYVDHIHTLIGANYYEQLVSTLDHMSAMRSGKSVLHRDSSQNFYVLSSYKQKIEILQNVRSFASSLQSFNSLPTTAMAIASELMMNAVFDAPVDPVTKAHRYAHLPRNQDLVLQPYEHIKLNYGTVGNSLVISVEDHFGSLDRAKIVSNLYRCAQQSDDQVRLEPGGAGVGLYMLLNMCSQLDFYIQPGRQTKVVAYVNAGKRQKDYEMQGAAINIFTGGGMS